MRVGNEPILAVPSTSDGLSLSLPIRLFVGLNAGASVLALRNNGAHERGDLCCVWCSRRRLLKLELDRLAIT